MRLIKSNTLINLLVKVISPKLSITPKYTMSKQALRAPFLIKYIRNGNKHIAIPNKINPIALNNIFIFLSLIKQIETTII